MYIVRRGRRRFGSYKVTDTQTDMFHMKRLFRMGARLEFETNEQTGRQAGRQIDGRQWNCV